jgi:hypothetical protein
MTIPTSGAISFSDFYVPVVNNLIGRLVVFYAPATSYWQGDYQIANIAVTGEFDHGFESSNDGWAWASAASGTISSEVADYAEADSYSTIGTSTAQFRFNRDYGGTPSSSTGYNYSEYTIYAETSNGSRAVFMARSPQITLSVALNTFTARVASYGSNVGDCAYYWMPTHLGSGSSSHKRHIGTDSASSSNSSRNLGWSYTA